MRYTFRLSLLLLFVATVGGAQTTYNPITQIRWPLITGSGAPTMTCQANSPPPANASAYGQQYWDMTNHAGYVCSSPGVWQPLPGVPLFGTGAPSATCSPTVNNGIFYTNTTAQALYQCNGATSTWVQLASASGSVVLAAGIVKGTGTGSTNTAATAADLAAPVTAADSGSANTYVLTTSPAISALTNNVTVSFIPNSPNTITAPNAALDGQGSFIIVRENGEALIAGDIGTGLATIKWDAPLTRWELQNPQNLLNAIASSDSSLNVATTGGSVNVGINVAHSNTFTATQTMTNQTITGTLTLSALSGAGPAVVIVPSGTNGGSGYTTMPTFTLSGGSCATAPTIYAAFSIFSTGLIYTITNGGSCSVAPIATITGGSPSVPATLQLALSTNAASLSPAGALQTTPETGGGASVMQYDGSLINPFLTDPILVAAPPRRFPTLLQPCSSNYATIFQVEGANLVINPMCGANNSIIFSPNNIEAFRASPLDPAGGTALGQLMVTSESFAGIEFNPEASAASSYLQNMGLIWFLNNAGGALIQLAKFPGTGYTGSGFCTLAGGTLVSGTADTCTPTIVSGGITISLSGTGVWSRAPGVSITGFTTGSGANFALGLASPNTLSGSFFQDLTGTWRFNTGAPLAPITDLLTLDKNGNLFVHGNITCGGSCGGGGSGTVTSVALTVPSWLTVAGSPVTTAGTFAVTAAAAQTSHQVIGTCGTATTFGPCSLAIADIPSGLPYLSSSTQLAQTFAAVTNQWLNSYNAATGLFTASQPGFSNLSGGLGTAQGPTGITGVLFDSAGTLSQATAAQLVAGIGSTAVANATTAATATAAGGLTGCSVTTAGSFCYWNGSAWTVLAGNSSGTQYLQENSSGTPSWTTPSGAGNVSNVGTPANGQWAQWTGATTIQGVSSASAFTTLFESVATALGDLIYGGTSGAPTRLAGSTSATKNFLCQTGTGSASAAPTWCTLASGDIPNNGANTTGNAATATLATTATNVAGGAVGSIHYQSGAGATAMLAGNTAATDQVLVSHGTGSAAQAPTLSNAPALSAANMTGFPTLNQNTTGTAANVTAASNSTLTTLSALSLPYSQVTGTPTTVANTTTTVGSSVAFAANTCSSITGVANTASTLSVTNLATSMTATFTPTSDVKGVTGWGPGTAGQLYFQPWPSAAGTLSYYVCNFTTASITTSASVTWNVSFK